MGSSTDQLRRKINTNRTLVVNTNGAPILIVSWQRAIKLIFEDRVFLIEPYMEEGEILYVHSPSIKMPKPAIVGVKEWANTEGRKVKFSRITVFIRDLFRCQYTGERLSLENASIDHIVPRSRGGKHTWTNVVTCSRRINAVKSDKTPKEAGLALISRPRVPDWSWLLRNRALLSGNPVWLKYFGGGA